MTKRFTCRDYKINYNIQCEEISDNGNWITYGEIVDLLNSLLEENEQLKEEITELENKNEILKGKLWNCRYVRWFE